MKFHFKHSEVFPLVKANQAVLLEGEKGTGKTTLSIDTAKYLNLDFFSISMTRQTTYSHLLGFMNVKGTYIPSQIRLAAENGGLVLLDELDASDPNVILCLNSIENGYLSFPDKVVTLHPDFRLMATCNPQDNHKNYNGRAKLDDATLDRFDQITVERDEELEKTLVDFETYSKISLIRKCLKIQNSNTYISMRDSLRFQKRKDLNLLDGFVEKLLKKDRAAFEMYLETLPSLPKVSGLSECETITDIWEYTKSQATTGQNLWA